MTDVLAPCAGWVMPLSETPDAVFYTEMMGPGLAIEPSSPGIETVVAPISGKIVALFHHAFVVLSADGVGVLTHLGINTVKLKGEGFELLAEKGATVEAGTPIVRWEPSSITSSTISPVVPVVAMERPKGSIPAPPPGTQVAAGDLLFKIEA